MVLTCIAGRQAAIKYMEGSMTNHIIITFVYDGAMYLAVCLW